MILKYFSDYLQENDIEPTIKTLCLWLKEKLHNPPKCHGDKVIQAEIYLAENKNGEFCLIGKSDTGRNLIKALYNYTLSCQNVSFARKKHFDNLNKKSD